MQIKAGQQLSLRKSTALAVKERLQLQHLKISRANSVWVLFAEAAGVSIHINRYPGNIRGFIPMGGVSMVNWASDFDPTDIVHPSYRVSANVTAIFPQEVR